MLQDYIQRQMNLFEEKQNFYTPDGIKVFVQEPFVSDVDLDKIISEYEAKIPQHLRDEVEMIIVGHFDEFEERQITAFYESGTIYLSNTQTDEETILEDIIHETSHSIESPYGYEIYGDEQMKREFLRKRRHLHQTLWDAGHKVSSSEFENTEYDQEFDEFLHQDIGYNKLSGVLQGVVINPYSVTSLSEYYATGFVEFFQHPDGHNYLSQISPVLYSKLMLLYKGLTDG
jgi:hypothetical protein